MNRRRLPRMLLILGWSAASGVLAAIVARSIHVADRRRFRGYVPQLDDPLRRGTDLATQAAREADAMLGTSYSHNPAPPPGLDTHKLGGAVLGLAYAMTETQARGWLDRCEAAGADRPMLDSLWAEWQQGRAADVTYLHTDRKDTRP